MKRKLTYIEIIKLLKAEKGFLNDKFGVTNIGLFGSYVNNEQTDDSDIDIIVELKEPRFDWLTGLQIYLEQKFSKKVEVVRKSKSIKSRFFDKIEKYVMYA
jgi:predicted nucleotidyltransferase